MIVAGHSQQLPTPGARKEHPSQSRMTANSSRPQKTLKKWPHTQTASVIAMLCIVYGSVPKKEKYYQSIKCGKIPVSINFRRNLTLGIGPPGEVCPHQCLPPVAK